MLLWLKRLIERLRTLLPDNITPVYVAALCTIALLALIGQLLVQSELKRQANDSLVVNIAGRQRMLSQRLSKTALTLQRTDAAEQRAFWVTELDSVVTQWQSAHAGLQNGGEVLLQGQVADEPVILPGDNSTAVEALFAQVTPAHEAMVTAAELILANPDDTAVVQTAVDQILANEATFLSGMEKIVFQYDEEAAARVRILQISELSIFLITLFVLLLEGLFVFRPAVLRIRRTMTELRQVGAELSHSEERYRSLVESSHDLIFNIDLEGQFTYVNQTWLDTLGYQAADVSGLTLTNMLSADHLTVGRLLFRQVMKGHKYEKVQIVFVTRMGSEIDVEGDLTPNTLDGEVIGVQGLFRNITKRKQAESALRDSNERLQDLSRRLIDIQEGERRHLARELHDEIGQRMTFVKMQLQSINQQSETAVAEQQLRETVHIVDETLQQVRSLSLDLHPSLLDDMGLVATLRWYLDRQAQWGHFQTDFQTNLTHRLPAEIELVCFRVAQEALTNVIRHAQASCVRVDLTVSDYGVCLIIEDDGKGFDVRRALNQRSNHFSLGLRGMEERVSLANGVVEIQSERGRGSKICLRLNVHQKAEV